MATKLSPKQSEVLAALNSSVEGYHYRGAYFVIGRSNGKITAAEALVQKGYAYKDYGYYRITDAGREALNGVSK